MSTATITLTATEITDTRLDVISHAREVLERACSEHGAWRGPASLLRVTNAMACLQAALRSWDRADSDTERDNAVRAVARWTAHVTAVIGDVMGAEAAAYVNCGEEGTWAA